MGNASTQMGQHQYPIFPSITILFRFLWFHPWQNNYSP